ncbi:MAG: hypothetical protein LBT38_12325 [Deltaproteobacteria bacterium]|jgi:hypothetical protein|nr:hypothetical protein [Deltaproteobacteria bacterium]
MIINAPEALAENDTDTLFKLARSFELPDDFDDWEITNSFDEPLALVAACYGFLPKTFDKWRIADKTGRTVAHEAAANLNLPEGFNLWYLTDNEGNTVRDFYNQALEEEAKRDEAWGIEIYENLTNTRREFRVKVLEKKLERLELANKTLVERLGALESILGD